MVDVKLSRTNNRYGYEVNIQDCKLKDIEVIKKVSTAMDQVLTDKILKMMEIIRKRKIAIHMIKKQKAAKK